MRGLKRENTELTIKVKVMATENEELRTEKSRVASLHDQVFHIGCQEGGAWY